MDTSRAHDIVLHGATGFVGALVAAHLAEHAPPGVRIALSGRSREKLERTRAELPELPHVVAGGYPGTLPIPGYRPRPRSSVGASASR